MASGSYSVFLLDSNGSQDLSCCETLPNLMPPYTAWGTVSFLGNHSRQEKYCLPLSVHEMKRWIWLLNFPEDARALRGSLRKKKKKRTHPSVSLKLLMEFVFVFNAALNIISVAWIKVKYYCVCHWNALSRPDYTTKFQLSTVKLTHTDLIWNLHRCLQKQCRPLNYIQNRWMFSKLCLNGW